MIEAAGLTKRYGTTVAVDDLSFTVPPGQVTGFLGPNGLGTMIVRWHIASHTSEFTISGIQEQASACRTWSRPTKS